MHKKAPNKMLYVKIVLSFLTLALYIGTGTNPAFAGQVIAGPPPFIAGPGFVDQRTMKPELHGLLDAGGMPLMGPAGVAPNNSPKFYPSNSLAEIIAMPAGLFDGIVINVEWAQLQPTPDKLDTSIIDKALDDIRAYNQQHSQTPLAAKLRVWQGVWAPTWVINLDGAPVTIDHNGKALVMGKFWTAKYQQAWRNLQRQLANKYDADSLIREVSNTSCSSLTDEPFIIEGAAEPVASMLRAGFTDEAYFTCLMGSASDYSEWRTTSIELPVDRYRQIGSGRAVLNPQASFSIMQAFRTALGPRAIFSNHALAQPESIASRGLTPVMDLIKKFGPPTEFQTANPAAAWLQGGQLDWDATIYYGVSLGARAIELWDGKNGFITIPAEKLRKWSEELKNNQTH